jgi:hypothetical protein
MKTIYSYIILLSLVSCAKVKMDKAPTVDFENKGNIAAISVGNYSEIPLTLVAYFSPEENAIDWSNPSFETSDSQAKKLEKISALVAFNGLEVDKIDQRLRSAIVQKEVYETIVDDLITTYDVFACDEITDAFDMQKCMDNEVLKNKFQTQEDTLQIEKSDKIKAIQLALDGKTSNTVNWINFDRIQAKISLQSKVNNAPTKIEFFANFIPGAPGRVYHSEARDSNNQTADIVGIQQYSKFYDNGLNGELTKLDFKILERTATNEFTGNYYLASLNMSLIPNLGIRYLGKIKAFDKNDKFLREGKMKFILASVKKAENF